MSTAAPDTALASEWAALAAAAAERWAAALPGSDIPWTGMEHRLDAPEPRKGHVPSADDLRRLAEAVHECLRRGAWFDKEAYDGMLADWGASDGFVHASPLDWTAPDSRTKTETTGPDAGTDYLECDYSDYPDDAVKASSGRDYGAASIRSSVPLAIVPPAGTPLRSPAVRAFASALRALLSRMRHLRLGRSASGILLAWGGPEGHSSLPEIGIYDGGGQTGSEAYPHGADSRDYASFQTWAAALASGSDGTVSWGPTGGRVPATAPRLRHETYHDIRPTWTHERDGSRDAYSGAAMRADWTSVGGDCGESAALAAAPVGGALLALVGKPDRTCQSPLYGGDPAIIGGGPDEYLVPDAVRENGRAEYAFDHCGTGFSQGWNAAGRVPAGGGVGSIPAPGAPTVAPPYPWYRESYRTTASGYIETESMTGSFGYSFRTGIAVRIVLLAPDFTDIQE